MDKIEEFNWKVDIKGFKKEPKYLLDEYEKIKKQIDMLLIEYNKIYAENYFDDQCGFNGDDIELCVHNYIDDEGKHDSNKVNLIELWWIYRSGKITGKLKPDKDTEKIHALFDWLHKKLNDFSFPSE